MKLDLAKLGQNIREYRQKAGLSQNDLASLIGSKQQVVVRWERGQVEPRLTTLYMITKAIELNSVADLLSGVELLLD